MAFDPDKYLEKKQAELSDSPSSSFDPDAYLQARLGAPEDEGVSITESAARGLVDQLGAAPLVSATAQHPLEALLAASRPVSRLLGREEASPESTAGFEEAREESLANFDAAREAHPYVYGGANVLGSLALTPLAPELLAAKGAMGAAKAGLALGAASGAGRALSEGKDIGDVATSAGVQGTIGGITGGVVGKLLSKLHPDELERTASRRALETIRPNKSTVSKIGASTPSVPGASRINEVGGLMNKPTPFLGGKSIVSMAGSADDILNNTKAAQKASGEFIGQMADKVDERGVKAVNPKTLIDNIDGLINKYKQPAYAARQAGESRISAQPKFNALNDIKQDITNLLGTAEQDGAPIDFKTAKTILSWIDDAAYDEAGNVVNKDLNMLRGIFNKDIEEGLDKVATETFGNSDLINKYLHAKDLYRATKQIDKAVSGNVASDITNKDLGLTDFIAGGFGYGHHGTAGAIGAVGLKHAGERYGNKAVAKAAQWTADNMRKFSTAVSEKTPEQLKNISAKLVAHPNPTYQKFGNILNNMAGKDAIGRNALLFTIMQNPTYRDIAQGLSGIISETE